MSAAAGPRGGAAITIVCNSYPPEKGGAPNRIYHLALLLRDAGYRVTVFTAMPNYPAGAIFPGWRGRLTDRRVEEDITVRRLWLIPSNATGLLRRGLSLLSWMASLQLLAGPHLLFGRASLVIISSPPLPAAFGAALLAKLGRKRILLNVSDLWPESGAELGLVKRNWLYRLLESCERRLYRLAGAVSGQSAEILARIAAVTQKPAFLYRNLQPQNPFAAGPRPAGQPRRIVYAGLLGLAQGLLGIAEAVDFAAAGAELHIYGDGLQRRALEHFLQQNPGRGICLHPTVPAADMPQLLAGFHAALVPLSTGLKGAVPSKIFMALTNGLPLLYSGGGEAANIVAENGFGFTNEPGDYGALAENVRLLAGLSSQEYEQLRETCLAGSRGEWNKEEQDARFLTFLEAFLAK